MSRLMRRTYFSAASRRSWAPLALIIILTASMTMSVGASELRFRVSGIDAGLGGNIMAGLYASEDGYPEAGYEVGGLVLSVDGEVIEGVFTDLPPGRYVVAVLHDIDGDGAMKTGFLGIPKEGYGFSGPDEAPLKPPEFDEAAAELGVGESVLVFVTMRYM